MKEVKLIIAGSRYYENYQELCRAINFFTKVYDLKIMEVVSGRSDGVDKLGEKWARAHSIPIRPFPADWHTFGRAAGPIRNEHMADYADALLVMWDERSHGTKDMINRAIINGLLVMPWWLP